MQRAEPAAFSFESFRVPRFRFDESNGTEKGDLEIFLKAKGKFFKSSHIFSVEIEFIGADTEASIDKPVIEVTSESKFKFDSDIDLKDIPPYFYQNSVGIIFPYLRAFIATLTLQAQTKHIMLNLVNVSFLKDQLKENTTLH